ncbi:Uncharacterised protein [Bordetella pertussis]|nr:Uncharacterised protein [Bordetella pertussis]
MRCAQGEKRAPGARVYWGCSSASTEARSYRATYLGHPFTATYRDERSKPGTVDRRGKCSVSYHSLNSSSRSPGGVIMASSRAFVICHPGKVVVSRAGAASRFRERLDGKVGAHDRSAGRQKAAFR